MTENDNLEISRRRLLGTVGAAGAAGLVIGAAGGAGVSAAVSGDGTAAGTGAGGAPALTTVGATEVMFHGKHQAGITDPLQSRGHLIAFDLAPGAGRKEAIALLRRWSVSAKALMAGKAPAGDTGVALDAGPSSLTVTIGFGRTFFDRTGLAARRPAQLDPLPAFSSDALDPRRSEGDLWVQIGADDALVAFHALRTLQKDAGDAARVRWQMNGFNRSAGATAKPMTARNLMGQVDGTGNPKPTDPDFDRRIFVPAGATGPAAWMAGGSYAVVRRIRMLLDDWEKLPLDRQEKVIGRRKSDGAPLTGGTETTELELNKLGPDGKLVIPDNAHSRISAPEQNGGAAMLRRPFSFHDGIGPDGTPDAGLLFICWQADPLRGFVPVQRKLDRGDALSEFIRHESSGLFAVPGGPAEGEYVGQRLLES
ncbi:MULTISPECIES: iron uptake transporter deferrochelatase/peroxidase subunit [Streptomyces]|uniref:Deferrochelatase n=1 Tax=Streptomyces venezuelae (strain ATCC 10712 / CBS 650.69 / DSM 40230 / JCM 4526 / NBRC 13096 / PD 04745) TaxID=953739 RepID=F2RE99_STRVP|nr:iron uptake transporter deferrochelatase/peroxidase subunit [Streptomyces venezuelae]APE22784.1 peroxidase [Streptomyces venezuelae]QES00159.1 deferrochelatase/peroxidase EfeB [Streptomyces venezuelae ATCC 10712]QES14071.1 deferrochelatase/peroxidase EfeB [Streptomyces venezuelae]CCA57022.1 Dyp-type peroxidase family protein [Streptomyces venezuelae ATCC 10712]